MQPSSSDVRRTSAIYGTAQTILVIVFGAAVLWGRGPVLLPITPAIAAAGLVLCVAGLLLLASALPSIWEAVQVAPAPKPGATLVTRGIYRWLRHPMYTGIVEIVIGLLLRTPTLLVAIVALVAIAFLAVKVRLEERLLSARYPGYAAYRQHTWGLFPFVRW